MILLLNEQNRHMLQSTNRDAFDIAKIFIMRNNRNNTFIIVSTFSGSYKYTTSISRLDEAYNDNFCVQQLISIFQLILI